MQKSLELISSEKKVTDFNNKTYNKKNIQRLVKWGIWFAFFVLSADIVYKTIFGITLQTREKCILYTSLPKWAFLCYEFFIELSLVVIAGIFFGYILEKYFLKYKRYYPQNQLTAFLYASVIPVCSCSVLPLIELMKTKLSFKTVITFVVAAPLLNPHIIIMSFSVIGFKYGILRIISSFLLAYSAGLILEYFHLRSGKTEIGLFHNCNAGNGCAGMNDDLYMKTYSMFKRVFPYLILAGCFALIVELFEPVIHLKHMSITNNYLSVPLVIIIGIPVYFCNGADIILLQPFINYMGLPLGTALAFSLTSTSVCITSLVIIIKFIGRRLTMILLGYVFIMTLITGYTFNWIF